MSSGTGRRCWRDACRACGLVPAMGREDLDCATRVRAIERCAQAIHGPLVVVAHSGGCIMLAHWAEATTREVRAALLATPPDFETPMPAGYPTLDALRAGGWLPVPRKPLPFPSIVAASRNDPLADYRPCRRAGPRLGAADLVDLGEVGHLNPASGYGEWPRAESLIDRAEFDDRSHNAQI